MATDWINEPWRKLYIRITADWLDLSVSARGLADELLKYADADGWLMRATREEAGEKIAFLLGARPKEHARIAEDVAELLGDSYLVIENGRVRIRNFQTAQEKRSPHALRQARYRQRQKRDGESSQDVTPTRDASVTQERDATVTHGRDAMSQGNETKRNETKRESASAEEPEQLEIGDLGEPENAKQRKLVTRWESQARHVLAAVSAARRRVNPKARDIRPSYASLEHIAARLHAGKTVDECLYVVEVCEDECRRKPDSFEWFNASTPFRPDSFERKLAQTANGTRASPVSDLVQAAESRVRYTD